MNCLAIVVIIYGVVFGVNNAIERVKYIFNPQGLFNQIWYGKWLDLLFVLGIIKLFKENYFTYLWSLL